MHENPLLTNALVDHLHKDTVCGHFLSIREDSVLVEARVQRLVLRLSRFGSEEVYPSQMKM